jgi:hypothetical protein
MRQKQKNCNVTITFDGKPPVTIYDLNEDQTAQLSTIFQASGVWYQWYGDYPGLRVQYAPGLGDWINRLMARWSKWMMPLLLLVCISSATLAQNVIEPVRISLAEDDREFNEHLREALSKFRVIVFTSSRFNCKVLTASTPITEQGRLIGYSVAVAILTQKADEVSLALHIETGPTLGRLAVNVAAYLVNEVSLSQRRKCAINHTGAK